MKKLFLVLLLIFSLTVPAMAQEWTTANSINVSWDAVSVPSGDVSYKVYTKTVPGGIEALFSTVSGTTATVTFSEEGKYFMGVRTVRTVNGTVLESETISWSDNPAVCQSGKTFGVQYFTIPAPVGGMRIGQ